MNNGEPTYITGSHYMFIQWSNIDVGYPDYRDANRKFFVFWEAFTQTRKFSLAWVCPG